MINSWEIVLFCQFSSYFIIKLFCNLIVNPLALFRMCTQSMYFNNHGKTKKFNNSILQTFH